MKRPKVFQHLLALLVVTIMAGCSTNTKSPDVSASIRKSLDQAGFNDVSVSQDRDKGVVTLGGQVPTDAAKSQAESIAKSGAGEQVVANQIAVILPVSKARPRRSTPISTKPSRNTCTPFLLKVGFKRT
jgi:hyperosmotically inducible protein